MTILKPCPFCGGEAYFRKPMHEKGTAFDKCMIECRKCGAAPYAISVYEFDKYEKKYEAIAKYWNMREGE